LLLSEIADSTEIFSVCNFRRKLALLGILKPLRKWQRTGRKPAQLFRFAAARFEKLKDKGILFPF